MKVSIWHALLVWAIGSLLAIALIGDSPYLGLVVALFSGVAFGVVNFWGYRARQTRDAEPTDSPAFDHKRNLK